MEAKLLVVKVKVHIDDINKTVDIGEGVTIIDLMREIYFAYDQMAITINGKKAQKDSVVSDGDEVVVIVPNEAV